MEHLTITEAAKAAGTTDQVLRIWEHRYGWPRPTRQRNGYRMYTTFQVEQLRAVVAAVADGHPIGEILRTGEPALPKPPPSPEAIDALIEDLRRQVALLREVVMLDVGRRFSDHGEALARIALNRTRAAQAYLDRLRQPAAVADG